ncbi:unnamed protein product [Owenia fusiformis]|uniref:Uncharacterized protein n=1 Tax=Owenia fusiformis TaxID=6347 RepID=A0A8J1XUC0_OWEFU|nr:unnamed protein product [Owenia fusiformis]
MEGGVRNIKGDAHKLKQNHREMKKGLEKFKKKFETTERLASSLKNALSDLRSEWIQIKREVQDSRSESMQLKYGQNDIISEAASLNTRIESTEQDSKTLKDTQNELNTNINALKRKVEEIKGDNVILKNSQSNTRYEHEEIKKKLAQMDSDSTAMLHDVRYLKEVTNKLKRQFLTIVESGKNTSTSQITIENLLKKIGTYQFEKDSNDLNEQNEKIDIGSDDDVPMLNILGGGKVRLRNPKNEHVEIKEPPERNQQKTRAIPKDCHDLYKNGFEVSGVYRIMPKGTAMLDDVYCQYVNNTGWTVIQRRVDGVTSFNNGWIEYKYGFGNLYSDFWLGNEKLHHLTNQRDYTLRVDMWDWEGNQAYAEYHTMKISSEKEKYTLNVTGYSGNAGDSLTFHEGMAFSTQDYDNDRHVKNCAADNKGGWWFHSCFSSHLNGVYQKRWYSENGRSFADGIVWYTLKHDEFYSLKKVEMKLRPNSN